MISDRMWMVSCGVGIAYSREFEVQLAATWCNLVQPTATNCNLATRAGTPYIDELSLFSIVDF